MEKLSIKVKYNDELFEILMTSQYSVADLKDAIFVVTDVEPYRQFLSNLILPSIWDESYKVVDLNLAPDFVIQLEDIFSESLTITCGRVGQPLEISRAFRDRSKFDLSVFASKLDEDASKTSTSQQADTIQPHETSTPLPDTSKVKHSQPAVGNQRRKSETVPITIARLEEELAKLSAVYSEVGSGDQQKIQCKPTVSGFTPQASSTASDMVKDAGGDYLEEAQPEPHKISENISGKSFESSQLVKFSNRKPQTSVKSTQTAISLPCKLRKREYITFHCKGHPYFQREFRPINRPRYGTRLVVLDIDQTLYDYRSTNRAFAIRPYLNEFLTSIYKYYEIGIWSETSMECIESKIDAMGLYENPNFTILFIMDKHAMIPYPVNGVLTWVKPLDVVWLKYGIFNRHNTVMCDDNLSNFALNPRNGILVEPYFHRNHRKDAVLLKLASYLQDIAQHENLFYLNHQDWDKNYIIVE